MTASLFLSWGTEFSISLKAMYEAKITQSEQCKLLSLATWTIAWNRPVSDPHNAQHAS